MKVKIPASETISRILGRLDLDTQEYVMKGHPDVFFRDGTRREIKSYGDHLRPDQRTQLEWMTELGQPWEILQEIRNGPVLRIRHLDTYDFYIEHLGDPRYRINAHDAKIIRTTLQCGELRSKLARVYEVSEATIDNVVNGKHCSHR